MKRVVFALLALCGCASAQRQAQMQAAQEAQFGGPCPAADMADSKYAVVTTKDAFDGYTKTVNKGFFLDPGFFGKTFGITLQRFINKSNDTTYQAFVGYRDADWFFIEANMESLIFLVDSARSGFAPGTQPQREVLSGAGVSERVMYEVPAAFIQSINKASKVQVRVIGSKGYRDFPLPREGFCSFGRFAADAIP